MDLSGLPSAALRQIAEAEVEAKYILRSEDNSLFGTLAPSTDGGEKHPGQKTTDRRNRAASHLFHVTARHLWDLVQPDLDALKAKLGAAKRWVDGKFHASPEVLNDAADFWLQWARKEVAENQTSSHSRTRSPRGLLSEAARKRGQALREGRTEGYVQLPSAVQVVPQRLLGVPYSAQPEVPGPYEKARVRAAFVMPILEKKGWSILDWANKSDVDFHTANDYLKGRTNPYRSTRKELAASLGVDVDKLPH
jgi:hypothetical protein